MNPTEVVQGSHEPEKSTKSSAQPAGLDPSLPPTNPTTTIFSGTTSSAFSDSDKHTQPLIKKEFMSSPKVKNSGSIPDYRSLAAHRIVETAERLERRIQERFGQIGLSRVAHEVTLLSREAMAKGARMARPNLLLRLGIWLTLGVIAFPIVRLMQSTRYHVDGLEFTEMVQIFDSSSQSLIFLALAGAFLFSLETRFKRRKLLTALHELRSLAHIVDMHQLTKDPEAVIRGGDKTLSSPERILDRFKLGRYLDYCSELLSLISKIGAIYVQHFPDSVALAAADQLSGLTNDLSRNVWQKIMILDQVASREDPVEEPPGTSQTGH